MRAEIVRVSKDKGDNKLERVVEEVEEVGEEVISEKEIEEEEEVVSFEKESDTKLEIEVGQTTLEVEPVKLIIAPMKEKEEKVLKRVETPENAESLPFGYSGLKRLK